MVRCFILTQIICGASSSSGDENLSIVGTTSRFNLIKRRKWLSADIDMLKAHWPQKIFEQEVWDLKVQDRKFAL